MAVLIEFFSVVVPKKVLQQKYDGGLEQYIKDCPNSSYKDDEHLTRVGFLDDVSLHRYCEGIISKGLHWDDETNSSTDFVVVQRIQGKGWKAKWLKLSEDGSTAYSDHS